MNWKLAGCVAVLALTGCEAVEKLAYELEDIVAEPAEFEEGPAPTEPIPSQEFASGFYRPPAPVQPVEIFDKGLGMVRSTVVPPAGWKVYHDIETDTSTLESKRYILDYVGPQGELIRGIAAQKYWTPMKQKFTPSWQASVRGSLTGVENFKFGETRHSQRLADIPTVRQLAQSAKFETLEAPFTATHQGKEVAGQVFIAHFPLGPQIGGTFAASVVIATPDRLDPTLEVMSELGRTEQRNPAFDRRMAELTNQMARRSAQQHQARMRQRQASFDAHQARMRSQSATFDAANKAWLNNFRGGNSGYTGHDQFIDSIHDRNSFASPNTGTAHNDVYKYNYSDGQGNFYGTDDPNFNPASLQGSWNAVDPLSP